ncbi:hypothetical protein QCA50_016561 [Cerrena zonata]|uniref:Uncharacterized protein n=1 Tax=Cerrena zonata TaxID=2478898 RepID=A0AAW0FHT0_9APHY
MFTHPEAHLEDVFKNTEPSKVHNHIAILTTALKYVQNGDPTSIEAASDNSKKPKIFFHISTLLMIGTPGDIVSAIFMQNMNT